MVEEIVNDSDILRVARGDGPRAIDAPCQLGGTATCLECWHRRCGGLTLQEVGDALGLTRERVRQLEVRALRKLRFQLKLLERKTRGAPAHHSRTPRSAGAPQLTYESDTR